MKLCKIVKGQLVESECSPTFEESFDAVVVGVGTAGAIAMLTAAERGLSVLGIDRIHAVGGTGTIGGICKYYLGARGGRYEQVNADIDKQNFVKTGFEYGQSKEIVLEKQIKADGAEVRFGVTPIGVYRESGKVCGLRVFEDGEIYNIGASVIIDSTANADICRMGGCETRVGRELDNQTQPYTNTNLFVRDDKYIYGMNKDAGFVNCEDAADYTKAVYNSCTMAINLKDEYTPDKKFVTLSPLLGMREGRVIVGEETISFEKLLVEGKRESKPIFYAYSNVDIHSKDIVFEDELVNDWYVGCSLWGVAPSVPVPLGAIRPKGVSNLFAAGRCLSVDHDIASCVRMKSDMEKCGEAAGECAALICQNGNVDLDILRERLRESGALDEKNNVGFMRRTLEGMKKCKFPENEEEFEKVIRSDECGLALWSAKLDHRYIPLLKRLLVDKAVALQAAMALALCCDNSGAEVLRECVKNKDNTRCETSDKFVWANGTRAVYLLGKLADRDSVALMYDILDNAEKYDGESYEYGELYAIQGETSSQYVAYAMRALTEIAAAHTDLREQILAKLANYNKPIEVTLKVNPEATVDLLDKMREYIEKRI